MPKSRWLVALICSLVAVPTISNAQAVKDSTHDNPQDFVRDVLRSILGPNWNLFAHGGFTPGDRFVLQRADNTIDGQRALRTSTGYNVGLGAGVDVLLRMGFRVNYTFTSNNMNFRTDDGTGSDALNIDDVARLKAHTAAFEVMRYMLPSRAMINPYGTLGIQGTWWVLDEKRAVVASNDATPFGFGPLFSFGFQVRASDHWGGRAEVALSSGGNPFTGKRSFRALSGLTLDEPTTVGRTDYRIAGVYHFGKPNAPSLPTTKPVAKKR